MRFLLDDPIYCRAGYLDVGEKKRKEKRGGYYYPVYFVLPVRKAAMLIRKTSLIVVCGFAFGMF